MVQQDLNTAPTIMTSGHILEEHRDMIYSELLDFGVVQRRSELLYQNYLTFPVGST